jgi:multiple sugar transport system substrate-binding protein
MSNETNQVSSFTRRRFLQYSGAAALGGSLLAACGGSVTGAATGSNGGVALQHWYHQYGETGTEAAAKRYAKEYTKASVTVRWTPGDYATVLNTALLSNNPPDVFEQSIAAVDQVKDGLFEPLDDILADVKDDFSAVSLANFTVGGKVYAIKMLNDTGLLYYRKSLLQKAGLQPPQTFDDVITAANKLTTSSVKGLFVGNDGGIGSLQSLVVWSAGGDFISPDNKIIFNTDRTAAAIEKIVQLNKTKSLLLGNTTDWWDPSAFTQGLAAMQWTGLWAMPAIVKALGDDFGVLPWPKLDAQGAPATFLGGWGAMVAAKGKNVQAAKDYVRWLWIDNKKDQEDWCLSYGFHIPPRASLAAIATKLQSGPALEAVQIAKQYGKSTSPLYDGTIGTAFTNAVTNAVKSNANITSELKKAEDLSNTELQKLV